MNNFLHDHRGDQSMMRLLNLLIVVAVVCVWTSVSMSKQALQDLPTGVVWMLGLALGGKAIQKFIEMKQP